MLLPAQLKTRLAVLLLVSLAALFPPSSLASGIEEVTPAQGAEGDLFAIQGSGFGNNPQNHVVIFHQQGEMIATEVLSASPNELIGRIARVGQPMTGEAIVYRGQRTAYANWILSSQGRSYRVKDASWFETTGPGAAIIQPAANSASTFSATQPGTLKSLTKVDDTVWLDVGFFNNGDGPSTIVISPVITCPPILDNFTTSMRFKTQTPGTPRPVIQLELSLEPLNADAASATADVLAVDLALALNQTFGSRGLIAQASGAAVQLQHPNWTAESTVCGGL